MDKSDEEESTTSSSRRKRGHSTSKTRKKPNRSNTDYVPSDEEDYSDENESSSSNPKPRIRRTKRSKQIHDDDDKDKLDNHTSARRLTSPPVLPSHTDTDTPDNKHVGTKTSHESPSKSQPESEQLGIFSSISSILRNGIKYLFNWGDSDDDPKDTASGSDLAARPSSEQAHLDFKEIRIGKRIASGFNYTKNVLLT
jgi:hypothetical protein